MRWLSGREIPRKPTRKTPPMEATAMRPRPRSRSAHLFVATFLSGEVSAIVVLTQSFFATAPGLAAPPLPGAPPPPPPPPAGLAVSLPLGRQVIEKLAG